MRKLIKAECGYCGVIDEYGEKHDEGCKHCGEDHLWLVLDKSDFDEVYDDKGNVIELVRKGERVE